MKFAQIYFSDKINFGFALYCFFNFQRRPMEVTITDANFSKEVGEADLPVLVDFWAPWCGPCRMVAPVVEEIAKEYSGKIKVGKVNVDDAPGIATQFGIMSIPTLMVFKGGKVMENRVGAMNKKDMAALIAPYIGK
jgi:thioredoxin 1